MTSLDRPGNDAATALGDPARLAATARAVLSCPAGVDLVVDGVDGLGGLDGVCMQDLGGVPTFSCPGGSTPVVDAATSGRRALLTLASGLGPTGSSERDTVLTLGGRLERRGEVDCDCCRETRQTVVLVVDVVVLTRPLTGERVQLDVDLFGSSDHLLNRGFLQRSADHANLSHQDELRRAVATAFSGTRLAEVVGVHLADLSPAGVEVRWVDPHGAHQQRLDFTRVATSPDELGDLLREGLHAGLC